MRFLYLLILLSAVLFKGVLPAKGQTYGLPDRGQPGDKMIQKYLSRATERIHERFLQKVDFREDWKKLCPKFKQEYFYMLDLWPMPQKTPLELKITGTLQGVGYRLSGVLCQAVLILAISCPKFTCTTSPYKDMPTQLNFTIPNNLTSITSQGKRSRSGPVGLLNIRPASRTDCVSLGTAQHRNLSHTSFPTSPKTAIFLPYMSRRPCRQ